MYKAIDSNDSGDKETSETEEDLALGMCHLVDHLTLLTTVYHMLDLEHDGM